MKNRIDRMMDEAFADELVSLAPEPVEQEKLMEQVFHRLELPRPAPVQKIMELSAARGKRSRAHVLLIAAVVVVLSAMGVFAASSLLKLSENKISYFEAAGNSSAAGKTSHEVTAPLFHQGLDAAIEKLNTPVGQTITYKGIAITLDTIAMDDNFLNLFFTAKYDKPVDLRAIYPDNFPGDLPQDGAYPEYSSLMIFTPTFWVGLDTMPNPGQGELLEQSADAYFVDNQTIRISTRYTLPETYPDVVTIYAKAFSAVNADGEQILGQSVATTDANPFIYQVVIDKSAGNNYRRSIKPGVYTIGDETLTLDKLMVSPFGALITYQQEFIDYGDRIESRGLSMNRLYMEDDKGNVIDIYEDPVRGFNEERIQTRELLNLNPDAKSITIMPFKQNSESKNERRRYAVEGIVGKKIEVCSFGGYIVRDYTISNGAIEIELEPYGRSHIGGVLVEFFFEDEGITMAGSRSGLIREQYNRDTNRYIYAVDYYAATDEELSQIQYFSVYYDDTLIPDWDAAITLPITVED